MRRGNGSSGSVRSGEATANGPLTSLVVINDQHVILNDGGLLREMNLNNGVIYTICDRTEKTTGELSYSVSLLPV